MIRSLLERAPIPGALGARAAVNTSDFLSRLGVFFLETSIGAARRKNIWEKRKFIVNQVHDGCRGAMDSLGYEIKVFGRNDALMKSQNFLMVGNHMSYMDPFVTAYSDPTLFVTSVDMGETIGLGHVTRMAGCIFIERRNRSQVENDLKQMTEALEHGFNVMIYPEGTSTNGREILPFKKSLLMAAVLAKKDILPIVLKYTEVDGEPFSPANADRICWYGDMDFGGHFLSLMKAKSLKAELHYLEPIKVNETSTRQDLAAQAYKAISEEYARGRDWVKTNPAKS